MSSRTTIWDLGEADKKGKRPEPVEVEMWSVDADEALKYDPKRYARSLDGTTDLPNPLAAMAETPESSGS
jgi:hypothetical protein